MVGLKQTVKRGSAQSESVTAGELLRWLRNRGVTAQKCIPLTGDVSPRRYFRVKTATDQNYVLAYYPVDLRPVCLLYSQTTTILASAAIRVPTILAEDCDAGLMLLEDVGAKTLYQFSNEPWNTIVQHFDEAVAILKRIEEIPAEVVSPLNPILGEHRLSAEITQTIDLFLKSALDTADQGLTREFCLRLMEICSELGSGELVPCHRDFMARNLVPLEVQGQLAVLDHQDLTLGPAYYDLASLLNDSLFPPLLYEAGLLRRLGLGPNQRTQYHRAAAQRTLKALGTYQAFANRGFEQHLPLVPKTLGRALHHLEKLPETRKLCPRLETACSLWTSKEID